MEKRKNLIQIATPIFVEQLLFMLLGVADIFMLSRVDDFAAASVGASNTVINNFNLIFAIISVGTGVLVAQNYGAKNNEGVKRVAIGSLFVNLFMGILLSIIVTLFGNQILNMLGVQHEMLEYASKYLAIVGRFIFIQALLTTVSVILRSVGKTFPVMILSVIMNVINITLDACFVFGLAGFPKWGVTGVAIATTFSRGVALIVGIILLFKVLLDRSDLVHFFKPNFKVIRSILKIGIPAALENISYSLSQTVIMSYVLYHLGEITYTARTYMTTIIWFTLLFAMAIGNANQIMVGQLCGAKAYDEAYKLSLKNFRIAFILSCFSALALFIFRENLMGIYTNNAEIIKIGAAALLIDAILEPGRTFNLVIINGLRGAGDVVFPVVLGIIFMWGMAAGMGYVFGVVLGFGLPGIFVAMALDEWIRGFFMLYRWKSKAWIGKVKV